MEQPGVLQDALYLLGPVFRQHHRLLLLVDFVERRRELLHHAVERDVQFRPVLRRARDNQRGASFVDQDGVNLVDDGVVERPLHHLAAVVLHVVAEVVETEFVIRAVGDVGGVGRAPLLVGEVGHDHADSEAEEAVHPPHPLRVAPREVVVDGDDVDALARQRVKVGGERRH